MPRLPLLCGIVLLALELSTSQELSATTLDTVNVTTSVSEEQSLDNSTTEDSLTTFIPSSENDINQDGRCSLTIVQKSSPLNYPDYLPSEKIEYLCGCFGPAQTRTECPSWILPDDLDPWLARNSSEWTSDVCRTLLTLEVTRSVNGSVQRQFSCKAGQRQRFFLVKIQKADNGRACKRNSDCQVPGQTCYKAKGCFSRSCCSCLPDKPVYVPGSQNHCYPEVHPGYPCLFDQQCTSTSSFCAPPLAPNATRLCRCRVGYVPDGRYCVFAPSIPLPTDIDYSTSNYRYPVAGGGCIIGIAVGVAVITSMRRRKQSSSVRRESQRPLVVPGMAVPVTGGTVLTTVQRKTPTNSQTGYPSDDPPPYNSLTSVPRTSIQ